MTTTKPWKTENPDPVTDLFGEHWVVTKRVDSGHGFDLIYGFRPHEYELIDNPVRGLWHILDEPIRNFVLADLAGFDKSDLPISTRRKETLRRMFSSLRYDNIPDWEERRDPGELTFYVDPEHIELPDLFDIYGQRFSPTGVRYYRPGFHIWTGTPDAPGHKKSGNGVILTQELAQLLYDTADLKLTDHEALGLPISMPVQKRLRRESVGYFAPTLHSFKNSDDRGRDMHIHPHYIEEAEISDVFGKSWLVHRIQQSQDGDIILRGSPAPAPRKGHPGVEYILTPELAALFQEHYGPGGDQYLTERLGISVFAARVMREKLDAGLGIDTINRFWIETIDALLTLEAKAFAETFDVPIKPIIAMRANIRFLGECTRGNKLGTLYLDALNGDDDAVALTNKFDFKTLTKVTAQRKAFGILRQAGLVRRYAGNWQLTKKGQRLLPEKREKSDLSEDAMWWLEHLQELRSIPAQEFKERYKGRAGATGQMRSGMAYIWACLHGTKGGADYIAKLDRDNPATELAQDDDMGNQGRILRYRSALKILRAAEKAGHFSFGDPNEPFFLVKEAGKLGMMHKAHAWWAERLGDLDNLSSRAFGEKYNRNPVAVSLMQHNIQSVRAWTEQIERRAYLRDLDSDMPLKTVAACHGYKTETRPRDHRKALFILKQAGKL